MTDKFKAGDIVVLKSGGPPMTVDEVPSDLQGYSSLPRGDYLTRWFKGASKEQGTFKEHLLEKYVPPTKK